MIIKKKLFQSEKNPNLLVCAFEKTDSAEESIDSGRNFEKIVDFAAEGPIDSAAENFVATTVVVVVGSERNFAATVVWEYNYCKD